MNLCETLFECLLEEYMLSSNMDHVGMKTRLLGQIIEKPCVHNRGFIFQECLQKIVRIFVLTVFKPCSNMGQ